MTNERLFQICTNIMDWEISGSSDSYVDYETFHDSCGISDEELKELGFGYLVDIKEADENIVYKNSLISIVWNDTRCDVLDSDGNYINYLFDSCFYDEEEQNEIIQNAINEFSTHNDSFELSVIISKMFDNIYEVLPCCGSDDTIKVLRKRHGEEFVCRVGNVALIIRE